MARKTPATMQKAADGGNSSDAHVCPETATGVCRARAAPIAKSTLPSPDFGQLTVRYKST